MIPSAAEMTLSYFLFKMLRMKVYEVLMNNFSINWGLVYGSLPRQMSSFGRMIL